MAGNDEVAPSGALDTDERSARFPIVGLGASAGGLAALEEFFSHMPADAGIAFVVVTHQHPDQPSMMHELVGRKTRMPVREVRTNTKVLPNHVYTATPGRNLAMINGSLQPMEPDKRAPFPLPIDYFFRSLAQDQRERAVGIILSGTGSDGTLGLKEIKAALGMVMVQQEQSAGYAGMPHSAIATGQVDYVLPPKEMPAQLTAYCGGARASVTRTLEVEDQVAPADGLQQVFVLLRSRVGHDFSQYKESTIGRRIERRMNVHHLDTIDGYVEFLQANPAELDLLFKELLIGVTSFFRDAEAFDALAEALPSLLANKPKDYVVRAWVPGCSTGEEAYSIAMLLRECMDQLEQALSVQIFATDLDSHAIDVARAGVYPVGIASDVAPERLQRFFTSEEDCFRIKKEVREMVVFAPQNLIEDPPFTKLDLLSCRNLLIYLDANLQKRLLPIFHYAIKSDGVLFLGSSESVGKFANLFGAVDKKWKVFRRKEVEAGDHLVEFPAALASANPAVRGARLGAIPARTDTALGQRADRLLLRELLAPTVLIHERGDIVHIHGRTGQFLEPAPGPQPVANVFNMAREGLALPLAAAIRRAAAEAAEVVHRDVRVRTNGNHVLLDLRARRVSEPEAFRGLFLITFERVRSAIVHEREAPDGSAHPLSAAELEPVAVLELELRHTRESHQATIEELETANEELKSTNEELQSTNEELQSANEELETSKEEMQSLNEELQTVNLELQGKVEELSTSNDDMKNLLNGTDIATIFLDNDLRIKRYTEQATRVIRLIPSDVGRPIGDLVSRLRYDRLSQDAANVLRTLVFAETEVRGEGDAWYLMRILPYRTTDNVIDGLVVTFTNTTMITKLQETKQRLITVLAGSSVTVFGLDRELRYLWLYGPAFGRSTATELIGKSARDLFDDAQADVLSNLERRALDGDTEVEATLDLTFLGRTRTCRLRLEPMRDEAGDVVGLAGVAVDLTSLQA